MRRPPRSTLFPYTTLRRVVPAQRGEVEPLRATRAPPRRCHLYAIEPCLAHQWIAGFRLTDFRALEQSWKRAPQALQTRPGTLILVRAARRMQRVEALKQRGSGATPVARALVAAAIVVVRIQEAVQAAENLVHRQSAPRRVGVHQQRSEEHTS